MIGGIILAAGRSRRMGEPKALLPLDGRPFVARAIGTLREGGCETVAVVVGDQAQADARAIARAAREIGAGAVENAEPAAEQIDSLRVGLRAVGDHTEAVIVCPVDYPSVSASTVRALIAAFRRSAAPVVVPTYGRKHGHPVLFARRVFSELLSDPLPEGARTVVHAHASDLLEVPVDDAAILRDVDTPADYRAVRGDNS